MSESGGMDRWRGKTAVVTGASSGIGAAVSRTLVARGMVVVGLARREDRLKALSDELSAASAPGKFHPKRCDLRNEGDILSVLSWVDSDLGGCDVLVNNAGVGVMRMFNEGKTEDWRMMMDVNVLAPAICCREFLNSLEKRGEKNGHIIIINSIAGYLAEMPSLNMYSASKHAAKAMAMSLRRELAQKGSAVKVTNICPGVVDTEMVDTEKLEAMLTMKPAMLKDTDVASVVVDALSASPVCQLCDIILTPVPTSIGVY